MYQKYPTLKTVFCREVKRATKVTNKHFLHLEINLESFDIYSLCSFCFLDHDSQLHKGNLKEYKAAGKKAWQALNQLPLCDIFTTI